MTEMKAYPTALQKLQIWENTEMIDERKTLGELLSDPRIRKIAPDAIRNRDLSREEVWNKTPAQLQDEHFFFGDIGRGFQRLYDAADTGDWYYPLYSEA